ncbi:MAG: glycogen/starch/alpha-glucan phosphorylase [Betaproteobacteria bacterium]
MAAAIEGEFSKGYQRAHSQRSDIESADAAMNSAALALKQILADRWAVSQAADAARTSGRRVHYLSMEFLMGRALNNALMALKLDGSAANLFAQAGHGLDLVRAREPDAAWGNGGLGRLAACFLDSFATLELPSFGYGLRYENGMFVQKIQDGRQTEAPDQWLQFGCPWEVERVEIRYFVGFAGFVVNEGGARRWNAQEQLVAEAWDFIVPGHQTKRVSTLRQWRAQAARPIDLAAFCRGEHASSGAHRQAAETLNWVLYPDDSTEAGRVLRLKQEYFLVSASLQDMLVRHLRERGDIRTFGKWNAVHLNDTHPALAPAELMRLLIDEHGLDWDAAWAITGEAVSYTNHTLMPEALETWPLQMLQSLLPRHLEIIYEINQRFLEEVRTRFPNDESIIKRVSLVDETGERRVRMASLAIVASRKVNGVSALHSQLMVQTIFADYAAIWPDRFLNVTNGVTPRRWLQQANPQLGVVIDRHIGSSWRNDLSQLGLLKSKAANNDIAREFLAAKRTNKLLLAEHIHRELGILLNVESLFDVQIKRVHEYKRQLLNVLNVVARYQAIVADPGKAWVPRTVIFAGKAASAYRTAKLIIQLIHDVGRVVNSDPRVGDKLKVVFLPNYSVSLAELIIPAADLSEQISTAGTEASGTGNMKFAMNGALTIGTWDGANIEMAGEIGAENMFVFGLRADAVARMKSLGYDPRLFVEQNLRLQHVIGAIAGGDFSAGEPLRYRALTDNLLNLDSYMLLADFADYVAKQSEVDAVFAKPDEWARRAILNIAGMGWFSTDRTIAEYIEKVWTAPAMH